ncbi:hypothetical protein BCIN_01g04320 [Botrytis cinerea B05.10]|uniref:Uncharacterized protein n=2 Tax=Botryotinia fuckeliana TaxID=40559 RepID=A0A384J596_BOTFB|nr:hypothetical protein BCIN_01g04320 [Botrytis cinerea B05.10]ATZ45696.1 hypothetical protein BCIN_01g04320 [Botrytis cinerea B05.10]EMR89489.1 hypothetical protein BcDW1_1947 [Botrytis cinerea BcDW1]
MYTMYRTRVGANVILNTASIHRLIRTYRYLQCPFKEHKRRKGQYGRQSHTAEWDGGNEIWRRWIAAGTYRKGISSFIYLHLMRKSARSQ